jgi:hypothetical protein
VLDRSAGQSALFAFTHGRGVWKVALPGSGDACRYVVTGPTVTLPASGGTAAFSVATADNCAWSAISTTSAATIQSPAGGKGAGSFTVSAATNTTAQPRMTVISVQDKTFPIEQDAALLASGNDESASAFDIGPMPSAVIENTSVATEASGDPVHSCTKSKDSKTLWFKVTASAPGTLRLSFANRRVDNGADSGTVLTGYPLVNGALGNELFCSLTPQATNVITTRSPQIIVNQAGTYIIEASATTAGAPEGAQIMGGNLVLTATLLQ